MHDEFPIHGGHPSQEVNSSQGGPLTWFLENFGHLNESIARIKQPQEDIIENQAKQGNT